MIMVNLPDWLYNTSLEDSDSAMAALFGPDWPATHDYALADTDVVLVDHVEDEALTDAFGDWANAYHEWEAATALAYRLEMRGM